MTDNRTIKQQAASFRGIPFYVRNEIIDIQGRRRILHEYPNSNRRYVEDLGEIPQQFSVEAFVTGEDWLQRATALREALNQKDEGKLVIPTFGTSLVFALSHTETSNQREVGEIKFAIKFALGTAAVAPAAAGKTEEDVFDLGDNSRISLARSFVKKYRTLRTKADRIVAAFDVAALANSAVAVVRGVTTEIGEIVTVAERIKSGVATLINLPDTLSGALFTAWGELSGLFDSISTNLNRTESSYNACLTLTEFGSGLDLSLTTIKNSNPDNPVEFEGTEIPLWPETTPDRIRRNENRKLIVQSARVAAIVLAYEQASAINYGTKEEVQKARQLIENIYKNIYQDQVNDTSSIQNDPDVRNALSAVRNASLEILEQKEQQAYGLTTINKRKGISSIALAYQLYAESLETTDELEESGSLVRGLNPTKSAIKLINDIEVFQTDLPIV